MNSIVTFFDGGSIIYGNKSLIEIIYKYNFIQIFLRQGIGERINFLTPYVCIIGWSVEWVYILALVLKTRFYIGRGGI
jgi:hypothetical protein